MRLFLKNIRTGIRNLHKPVYSIQFQEKIITFVNTGKRPCSKQDRGRRTFRQWSATCFSTGKRGMSFRSHWRTAKGAMNSFSMTDLRLQRVFRTTDIFWREPSRMSCPAIRRCAENTASAPSGGTVTVFPWNMKWRRSSSSPARRKLKTTESASSTRHAGELFCATPPNGRPSSRAWAAGSISATATAPWTPNTWSPSGTCSSASGTKG